MVDLRRIVFPTLRSLLHWESRRKMGIIRFVTMFGAMGFGLTMYVCMSVLFYVAGYGAIPLAPRSGGGPILGFLLFLAAGVGWALFLWIIMEIPYASHRRRPIRF